MPTTLSNQPTNVNFLSPVGFRFNIKILPKTNWFVTSANLPGITLGEVLHSTPLLQAAVAGNDLTFEPLTISFLVDEDLQNWRELYDWMIGLGFPENYTQYKKQKADTKIYSDATLTILNSNMKPNYRIVFTDLFPTSLSEIPFDSASTDIEGIKVSASFRYLNYTYEKV